MEMTITSKAPAATSIVIANGTAQTGYVPVGEWDFGNAVWEHAFSGPRGTLGALPVGAAPKNRGCSWPVRVTGTSKDDLAARVGVLQRLGEDLRVFGGRAAWRDARQTQRQHFDILAGQGSVQQYRDPEMRRDSLIWIITTVCAPYLEGDPLDFRDTFATDTIASGDWLVTEGSGLSVTGNHIAVASTTVKRLVRRRPGYTVPSMQASVILRTGGTLTGLQSGPGIRIAPDGTDSGIYAFLEADGLHLRRRVAGVSTSLDFTAFTPALNHTYLVRVRSEHDPATLGANVFYAEVFTSNLVPTPLAVPDYVAAWTPDFDTEEIGVQTGLPGLYLDPASTSETYGTFAVDCYIWHTTTSPSKLYIDAVPGDSPARYDAELTFKENGDQLPVWAMLAAYDPRPLSSDVANGDPAALPLVGIQPAILALDLSATTITSDAGTLGGFKLHSTSTTWSAWFDVLPDSISPDDYTQGEVEIEVWGRVKLKSTTGDPRIVVWAQPHDDSTTGSLRYTAEFGELGAPLRIPTAGAAKWSMYRLGTLRFHQTTLGAAVWRIAVLGLASSNPDGVFDLDYLLCVPARRRAAGPTAKAPDGYPNLLPAVGWTGGNEITKTLRADGSATVGLAGKVAVLDHGIGQQLELPAAAALHAVVKVSSQIPDGLYVDDDDQLTYTHAIHFRVTPRYALLRP